MSYFSYDGTMRTIPRDRYRILTNISSESSAMEDIFTRKLHSGKIIQISAYLTDPNYTGDEKSISEIYARIVSVTPPTKMPLGIKIYNTCQAIVELSDGRQMNLFKIRHCGYTSLYYSDEIIEELFKQSHPLCYKAQKAQKENLATIELRPNLDNIRLKESMERTHKLHRESLSFLTKQQENMQKEKELQKKKAEEDALLAEKNKELQNEIDDLFRKM